MELHFVKGKESNFVLEIVVSGWKKEQTNMDTNMDTESYGKFMEKEP